MSDGFEIHNRAEISVREYGMVEGSFREPWCGKMRSSEVGEVKNSLAQIGLIEARSAETSSAEAGPSEVGFAQVGPFQISPAKTCPAQASPA